MKDIFSFSRFWLLIRKFARENRYTYLLYLTGMASLLLVIYGLVVLVSLDSTYPENAASVMYIGGLIFGSAVFAGSFYGFFSNRARGIQFLNLPSSPAEKLMLGFLVTQLVFFVVFNLVFYGVDQLMCLFYDHFRQLPENPGPQDYARFASHPLNFGGRNETGALYTAITLSAVAHFGSLVFERNAYIKTLLILFLTMFALLYGSNMMMKIIIPEEMMVHGQFYNDLIRLGNGYDIKGVVHLPKAWDDFVRWYLPISVYVLFWTASYFRLKEKQV